MLVLIKSDHWKLFLQLLLLRQPHMNIMLPFCFVLCMKHCFEMGWFLWLCWVISTLTICQGRRPWSHIDVRGFIKTWYLELLLILIFKALWARIIFKFKRIFLIWILKRFPNLLTWSGLVLGCTWEIKSGVAYLCGCLVWLDTIGCGFFCCNCWALLW